MATVPQARAAASCRWDHRVGDRGLRADHPRGPALRYERPRAAGARARRTSGQAAPARASARRGASLRQRGRDARRPRRQGLRLVLADRSEPNLVPVGGLVGGRRLGGLGGLELRPAPEAAVASIRRSYIDKNPGYSTSCLRRRVGGDRVQPGAQTMGELERIARGEKCMKKTVGSASSMWLWSAVT